MTMSRYYYHFRGGNPYGRYWENPHIPPNGPWELRGEGGVWEGWNDSTQPPYYRHRWHPTPRPFVYPRLSDEAGERYNMDTGRPRTIRVSTSTNVNFVDLFGGSVGTFGPRPSQEEFSEGPAESRSTASVVSNAPRIGNGPPEVVDCCVSPSLPPSLPPSEDSLEPPAEPKAETCCVFPTPSPLPPPKVEHCCHLHENPYHRHQNIDSFQTPPSRLIVDSRAPSLPSLCGTQTSSPSPFIPTLPNFKKTRYTAPDPPSSAAQRILDSIKSDPSVAVLHKDDMVEEEMKTTDVSNKNFLSCGRHVQHLYLSFIFLFFPEACEGRGCV